MTDRIHQALFKTGIGVTFPQLEIALSGNTTLFRGRLKEERAHILFNNLHLHIEAETALRKKILGDTSLVRPAREIPSEISIIAAAALKLAMKDAPGKLHDLTEIPITPQIKALFPAAFPRVKIEKLVIGKGYYNDLFIAPEGASKNYTPDTFRWDWWIRLGFSRWYSWDSWKSDNPPEDQ